jgi:hypothetical protein
MDLSSLIQFLPEFIIAVLAAIVGGLVLDRYGAFHGRATVKIEPVSWGNSLGFSVKVRGRTLSHAGVLFGPPWEGDLRQYDLVRQVGKPEKMEILIPGGPPAYFFPYEANLKWKKVDDSTQGDLKITDVLTKRVVQKREYVLTQKTWMAVSHPEKPSSKWEVAIQVFGEGLDRKEIQYYCLGIEPFFSRDKMESPIESSWVNYQVTMKKRPHFWWLG